MCLDSIEHQTYQNIEVIIIDDGSTDETLKTLYKITESSRFEYKIFSQNNSGQSVARNRGLKEASGEYIVFIDSDDWLSSDTAIEKMVTKIVEEKADFVQCSLEFVRGKKHSAYVVPQKEALYGEQILIDMLNVKDLYTSPCAKIYSNYFLKKYKLTFIEGLVNEDTGFSILMASKATKAAFLNDIVYSSREREGSTSRTSFIRMFKTMHEVLTQTNDELKKDPRYTSQVENYFHARYLRSMLYNLLQTAQRSDFITYTTDLKYCLQSTLYKSKMKYKKYLPFKHRMLATISLNKSVFFILAKTMSVVGIKMH